MISTSCPTCRLRFSATGATLASCPFCAGPLQAVPASALLGYKLIAFDALVLDEIAAEAALARASAGSTGGGTGGGDGGGVVRLR